MTPEFEVVIYGLLIGFLILKGPKLLIELVTVVGLIVMGLLIGLVSLVVNGTEWVRDRIRGSRSGDSPQEG